jgi:hypothetical protein
MLYDWLQYYIKYTLLYSMMGIFAWLLEMKFGMFGVDE